VSATVDPLCPECRRGGEQLTTDREGTHFRCPGCGALWGASPSMTYHHTSAEVGQLTAAMRTTAAAPPKPAPPPLTALDWQIIVQAIATLVTMGTTVIEVHPARWGLWLAAAMRYGGPLSSAPEPDENGEVTAIPLGLMLGGKPVRAVLRRWEPCGEQPCEGCDAVAGQADAYPVPEEESPIILPGQGRRPFGRS
jgi:hypothetical protein